MISDKLPFTESISESTLVEENKKFGFDSYEITFKEADIKLLITDGLRKNKQNTDEANQGLEHIELYFCLPSYFDINERPWPVKWLNKIAEIPQKNNTWFGHGDTIPAGNPPKKLDEQFEANHFILSQPIHLNNYLSREDSQPNSFKLLAVIPVFQNELDFKMRNSHTILFKKFANRSISEKVDVYRKSALRKRILGFF